jgi:hypothetical protein
VRSILRSTDQLSDLRSELRRDLHAEGVSDLAIGDFVAALNEVASATLTQSGADNVAIEVRWHRASSPHAELCAEIRSTAVTPTALLDEGIVSHILRNVAQRIEIHERIGGSVIVVRSRI